MPGGTVNRYRERMTIISLVLFCVFFALRIGFGFYCLHTQKSFSDVATGTIYPLNVQGWIVYIDEPKHRLLEAIVAMQWIFSGIFAILVIVFKQYSRKPHH